jgi:hypothetical protein
MKNIFAFTVCTILFTQCAPPMLVNREDLRKVPVGSTKVITKTPLNPDDAFSMIAKNFAKAGCPVISDKTSMQVICNGRAVEGETMLKALAFIEPEGTGSSIIMSGEWGLTASGQAGMSAFGASGISGTNKVVWEGVFPTKACVAFQHLILMSNNIPNGLVSYAK